MFELTAELICVCHVFGCFVY